MISTWKQNLKKLSNNEYKMLREMCHLSKNVYNTALYNIRQHYFSEGSYLKYEANYFQMRDDYNYKLLGTAVSQQTMKCADYSFRSFFKLLEMIKERKFTTTKISIPHYLEKDGMYPLYIPTLHIKDKCFVISTSPELKHKYGGAIRIRIPDKLLDKHIRQVHIIPKYNGKYFEAHYVYDDDTDYKDGVELDNSKFLGIDLGVNNLATCVTNEGASFIIDGKHIKSINQWYNKELARLSSIKDKQKIKSFTKKQYVVTTKRNNRINDYLYCAAKYIVKYCIQNHIGNLVVGYNEGFQQNVRFRKNDTQNFVMIPMGRFKDRLKLLCERYGINFVLQEESYTSQASFFDNDDIPTWNPRNPKQGKFSGYRNKRCYTRKDGKGKVHADVNGALNILRKSKLTDLTVLQSRGAVVTPLRIRPNKANFAINDI